MKWNPDHVRLHLDHIPVIDEDYNQVDYLPIIEKALKIGYESVMVDGSRLYFEEAIKPTKKVVKLAHQYGGSLCPGFTEGIAACTYFTTYVLDHINYSSFLVH